MDYLVDTISPEKLKKELAEAELHLEKAAEALSFLVAFTADQRQHTAGKLKHGEEQAMANVVDTVEKHAASFAALKVDVKQLAPVHVRELIARREMIAPIAAKATALSDDLTDTLLHLGETLRERVSPAYHAAVQLAGHDSAVATSIQPARTFYRQPARAAARSRKTHASQSAK